MSDERRDQDRRTIVNVHERCFRVPPAEIGALIDSLASRNDRLWPSTKWPAIRFDRSLGVGASGGHGPIRYDVCAYAPGQAITFRFRAPRGFLGTHGFAIVPANGGMVLRHVLEMQTSGLARVSWPLVFRPLHDALIEDALDKAELQLTGSVVRPASWSRRVRTLRRLLAKAR